MTSVDLPTMSDFLIIGGGTAGLVVACRLSENPEFKVIVLESGSDATTDPRVRDPRLWRSSCSDLDWKMKIEPQPGLENREQDCPAGKVLGGCSSINGLVYLPPSPSGIDVWAKLGNTSWTWDSLRPYIQKSITVTPPKHETQTRDTLNDAAPSGSIKVTYPALADKASEPLIQAWHQAFRDQGYEHVVEIIPKNKVIGTRDYTATIDPTSGLRSSADNEYGAIAASRSNVTIITNATVERILLENSSAGPMATAAEFIHSGERYVLKATKEIILAAGAMHTPKILELSGVGDRHRLDDLGIPVIHDLPGVGENFQTHLMSVKTFQLKAGDHLEGLKPEMKAVAFTRLSSEEFSNLFSAHKIDGKAGQVIKSILQNPDNASACFLIGVLPGNKAIIAAISCFPFSRGSSHISSNNPQDLPTVDAGLAAKELDIEILARHIRDLYQVVSHEPLSTFFEVGEMQLDLEGIKNQIRATGSTTHHACGTTAMFPQADGGVVDEQLKVYGIQNLRIVDASIFPLIPHANPISTVYAVAERASDLIRGNHLN
ncbi:glucose-methanol-choline (gmc) oxidoreductase [Penicillium malachiteum]|uniref:glucose-methanol-choline (gmc) oxidoreductase n=1 Tax=Penicillium malachiteum TaxID=1324776 RepID=UPI0025490F0C|nr:glucose-methanol-choline (gmc) oxidoreductase [Penicillium malachiteum]KAJ5720414.1 glucose-methanol-choline (gmc) oxidoreductase [Penicillium malachiteum]